MIAIIDYGMGNLRSVEKAIQICGGRTKVTSSAKELKRAEKIVFPGVGAFGAAMAELKRRRLIQPIKEAIMEGKPFLGLCLGLQLLFEKSEEAPSVKGLAILKGSVKRFRFTHYALRITHYGLKVPHMGWNNIVVPSYTYEVKEALAGTAPRRCNNRSSVVVRSKILKNVPNGAYMYFVHSYYVEPEDKDIVLTTTNYGIEFVSGIHKDNIYAFQFHPEKSQKTGLKILENFVRL